MSADPNNYRPDLTVRAVASSDGFRARGTGAQSGSDVGAAIVLQSFGWWRLAGCPLEDLGQLNGVCVTLHSAPTWGSRPLSR